jgi:hypothetical protein
MKAKIYKIVLPCGGTYIGQTSKHEYQRWGQHLTDLDTKKHYNKQLQESYNKGEVDNWEWEVIEVIENDDKSYINLMEQHYAALEINLINERQMHVNAKARNSHYRKHWKKEKQKEYYQNNREKIKKRTLEYYHKNKSKDIQ